LVLLCVGTFVIGSSIPHSERRSTALRDRVHLLGRVPHAEIEQLMRAADLFVLASHREGGNFSLTEALATGLTPIVTDIPSSRTLIGNATVGALWPCEDWRALADELRTASVAGRAQPRSQVRAYFDAQLSSDALGQKFNAAYSRLIGSKPPALVAS
jgi:glycosyltransferase involved in cell wall biosynthesis